MKKLILIMLMVIGVFAAPKKGELQKDFQLPSLYDSAKVLNSSSLKGKIVLLNMWASWCSGCQEEMPLFVDLQKKYDKNEFEIVLVNIDTDRENGIEFLQSVDPDRVLTALFDQRKFLPKAYRAPGMPTSLLIDKDGTIIDVYIGSFDADNIIRLQKQIKFLTKSLK